MDTLQSSQIKEILVLSACLFISWFQGRRQRISKRQAQLCQKTQGKMMVSLSPNCKSLKCFVINKAAVCDAALMRYVMPLADLDEWVLLGFDVEWKPNLKGKPKNPPAVVQLSTKTHVFVLCISHFSVPSPALAYILSSNKFIKSGVAVLQDAKRLMRHVSLGYSSVVGCVDLRLLAVRQGCCPDQNVSLSLRNLSRHLLGIEISKANALRCSNWEDWPLTMSQSIYAAKDAIVSRTLLLSIISYKKKNVDIDENIRNFVIPIVDKPFSIDGLRNDKSKSHKCQNNIYNNEKRLLLKRKRRKRYTAFAKRDTPLYDNVRMLAPDGQLIAMINHDKVKWYMKRGLATVENEVDGYDGKKLATVIRLTFEPKGRRDANTPFFTAVKNNCCVTCGNNKNYVRHYVIPHSYRKYFPHEMKSHDSHGIVLLCVTCQEKCQKADERMKRTIARDLGIKYSNGNSRVVVDVNIKKIRCAANALLKCSNKLPEQRIVELKQIIRSYFDNGVLTSDENSSDVVSRDELLAASQLDSRVINEDYIPHEKIVIDKIISKAKLDHKKIHVALEHFNQRWQKHFLNTMNPQYLSPHWKAMMKL